MLLEQYDLPEHTQFGSTEMVALSEHLYTSVGSPYLSAAIGWEVWALMIDVYNA